jgi:hypothetical protein
MFLVVAPQEVESKKPCITVHAELILKLLLASRKCTEMCIHHTAEWLVGQSTINQSINQ